MGRYWDYDKKGRFYKRKTGTKRYPDTGDVCRDGRKVGVEKVGHHHFGTDFLAKQKRPKKFYSKKYKHHNFRTKRGGTARRGGYRRRIP